jgi:hypothetical protein
MESAHTPLDTEILRLIDTELIPNLCEFINIPNLSRSYDPNFFTNGLIEKAMNFCLDFVKHIDVKGLTTELLSEPELTPCILGIVPGTKPNPKTIFMYGHIDKQPHFEGWH